jgi:hypothetical protein
MRLAPRGKSRQYICQFTLVFDFVALTDVWKKILEQKAQSGCFTPGTKLFLR